MTVLGESTDVSIEQQPLCTSSAMMQAASTGNMGLLERLLNLGADISVRADDGSTVLHCAVKAGHIEMIERILRAEAQIEVLNEKERSPLHEAVLNQDHPAATLLLRKGANVSQRIAEDVIRLGLDDTLREALDSRGDHLLEHVGAYMFRRATELEQSSILLTFLQSPAISCAWVEATVSNTLYVALIHGRLAPFKCLLACNKLNPNLYFGHKSILHIAAAKGHTEIVKLLVESRACEINAKDGRGYTSLIRAALNGRIDTVKALLSHPQVEVNGSFHARGQTTALHAATRAGHVGVVELLLNHPNVSINALDSYGYTPFHHAIHTATRGTEMVSRLMACDGIEVTAPGKYEGSLLLWAVEHGDVELVHLLLDHPRTDSLDTRHTTISLVRKAVFSVQLLVAELLLRRDQYYNIPFEQTTVSQKSEQQKKSRECDIMAFLFKELIPSVYGPDQQGQTLYHKMAQGPYSHLVAFMLHHDHRKKIAPSSKDNGKKTALHYAALHSEIETARLLIPEGSTDVNAEDSSSTTAIQYAWRRGDTPFVELLLRHGAKVNLATTNSAIQSQSSAKPDVNIPQVDPVYISDDDAGYDFEEDGIEYTTSTQRVSSGMSRGWNAVNLWI